MEKASDALAPGETVDVTATVAVAMNGADFFAPAAAGATTITLQVRRKFRIGYMCGRAEAREAAAPHHPRALAALA